MNEQYYQPPSPIGDVELWWKIEDDESRELLKPFEYQLLSVGALRGPITVGCTHTKIVFN